MREILFRGKRWDNCEWVYWTLLGKFTETQSGKLISGNEGLTDWVYELLTHPDTVGQYTGLCDKNGKKIFEGDIVKGNFFKGEIKFREDYGTFGVCIWWNGFPDDFCTLKELGWLKLEVIGNIHDNPELLKGEKNDTYTD